MFNAIYVRKKSENHSFFNLAFDMVSVKAVILFFLVCIVALSQMAGSDAAPFQRIHSDPARIPPMHSIPAVIPVCKKRRFP